MVRGFIFFTSKIEVHSQRRSEMIRILQRGEQMIISQELIINY